MSSTARAASTTRYVMTPETTSELPAESAHFTLCSSVARLFTEMRFHSADERAK
jgi:hypothetical protein